MKLNRYARQSITNALMSDCFDGERKKIAERKTDVADRMYKQFYGAYVAEMRRMPKYFWWQTFDCLFNAGGYTSGHAPWKFSELRLLGYEYKFVIDVDDPLVLEIQSILDDESDMVNRRTSARTQAEGIIASVTTLEKLVKVWPEIEPYTKQLQTEQYRPNLPVLPIKEINALLHIPKS